MNSEGGATGMVVTDEGTEYADPCTRFQAWFFPNVCVSSSHRVAEGNKWNLQSPLPQSVCTYVEAGTQLQIGTRNQEKNKISASKIKVKRG